MKKNLLSILFIVVFILNNCGKGVIPVPTSNKYNNVENGSFSREDLLNTIKDFGELNLNAIGTEKLVIASFTDAQYNEENTNQIIISLDKGPGFKPTQFSANKDINVEDTLHTLNKKIKEIMFVGGESTNSAISNIAFVIDTDKLDRKVLTLKLDLQLNENGETDIDTNEMMLQLDLGYLRNNQRPSVLWWWRSNIRN